MAKKGTEKKKDAEQAVRTAVKKLTGTVEGSKKAAELPLASAIHDTLTMEKAIKDLTRAHELNDLIKDYGKELEGLKADLTALCLGEDIPGFRHGNLTVRPDLQTRTSLNKELLIDNGVPPEIVGKSYKESAPFYVVRLDKVL